MSRLARRERERGKERGVCTYIIRRYCTSLQVVYPMYRAAALDGRMGWNGMEWDGIDMQRTNALDLGIDSSSSHAPGTPYQP